MRAIAATLTLVLALTAAFPMAAPPAGTLSPADADRFVEKLDRLSRNAPVPGKPHRPLSLTVTEQETNAFLRYRAQALLPAGVLDPGVAALGDGRVQGTATVDLDTVRQSRERGWLDPMRFLRGRVPIAVVGTLRAQGGTARFVAESAEAGGVPVPRVVLQELVAYYTRSDSRPAGISLDEPFPLPAGIREITVQQGRAIIVQ